LNYLVSPGDGAAKKVIPDLSRKSGPVIFISCRGFVKRAPQRKPRGFSL